MDKIDDAYNGLMGEDFMRKTRERLHWMCSKVVGEKILDVGCSQGTLARLLAPLGKSVLGVDINKDAISYAEGKLPELDAASRERLQFVAMNFMDFKSEERFDTVVMGEILEHLPDPAAFVKKACSHLAKGGTIVATVPFGINDDPDHRQTFYWSWIRDIVAPLFDVKDIEFFGKWIGVVGTRRERRATVENTVPLAVVRELEKAFYAIERPLVNDNKTRGLRLKAQSQDLAAAKKDLDAKAAEAQTALAAETAQKARADKAEADYAKIKTDLLSEIARQKDALAKLTADKDAELTKQKASIAKLTADKAAADAAAAKQKTALAAEQAKVKDINSKLAATRNELAATKNEALELRVNLDADRRISDGQAEQISVLKAALQFAANRPQIETNDTRLLEYSQEVRQLRSELESKRDEAVERAERLGHLSGQVESLKAEKELLSSRIAELAEALDRKIAEVATAAEYAKLFEPENARLEDERKKLLEKVAELSAREKELEESLASATEESNSKTEAINRIAAERTEFERDNALLRQDCKEKDSQLAELQHVSGEIAALEQKNRQCEAVLAQERARVAELTTTLAQAQKDAGDKVAKLSAALAQAQKDAEAKVSELTAALAQERKDAEDKTGAQLNSIGELEAYVKLCEAEIAKLTNDQEALSKAKDVQSRDIGVLKEEKGSVEASLAAANAEKGALASRVSELESSLAAAKDAAEENVARILELSSDLSESKTRADRAVANYYKLKSDLTSRIAKQDDALANANARADKAAGDYRKLKSDLLSRIAKQDDAFVRLTKEKTAAEAAANSEKEGLSSRISELEATLVAAKEESEEKNAKVIALTSDLEKATARAEKAAADYRKLKSDLLSRIAKQGDALAKLAAEKAAAEADAAKRDAELSNLVDSLRKERTGLLAALRHSEKIAQRESGKYDKLAQAKLGRLTLAYWLLKDGLKKKLTDNPDKNTHSRTDGLHNNDRKSVADSGGASKASPVWSLASDGGLSVAGFRILFPCGSGNNPGANPFVGTLMETLKSLGAQVFYGADRLFKEDERFNVVHFMWPDALFGWTHEAISPEMIAKLEDAIKRHKESGAVIAYTRHNARPHVDDNPLLIQAYDIVERSADLIFHMGEYSMKEFLDKHPESSSKNVVVPHHTYARISRSVTRKEAREWFGLSEDDKVVLSFGVFRNDDERNLLLSAVKGCNIENLKVLAPRFSSCPPPWIMGSSNGGAVPEQILPMYFAAADVVFIQRCHILNSGNVPMAFYFGCACVGPDDGNVGEILRATGNPVFDPANQASAAEAIVKAFAAIKKYNRGVKNKKWADKNWNQELVVGQIVDAYKNAFTKCDKAYRPRISIVVVGDKDEKARQETIASIESQTYPSEFVEVVGSSRIYEGLQKAKGELVAVLQNGDKLSRQFLEYARVPFQNADVDCVALKWSLTGRGSLVSGQSYTDKIISRSEEGLYLNARNALPILGSLFGRLFRKEALDKLGAAVEQLDDRTGVLPDSDAIRGIPSWRVYLMGKSEYFVPSGDMSADSILREIEQISVKLRNQDVPVDFKRIYMGRLQMLTDRLCMVVNSKPARLGDELRRKIIKRESQCAFFNRSLFGQTNAIAFCHNFPPAIDASSFVSAKRLGEIDKMEGELLNWTVVSQDMRSIRPLDFDFQLFYADVQNSRHIELKGKFGFAPILQEPYAQAAVDNVAGINAKVIYSRSFFIGSHMAAYQYKMKHPEVKWYAEFSDPVAYAVDNTVRACPDKGPTWFDMEKMVYELADVIIFTNEKQRAYMLGYNPCKELNDQIMRKSVVMNQPVLGREYCMLTPYNYPMDQKKINIGYFGTFYKNRTGDDMLQLLENKNVVLHVFTTKPQELSEQCARFGDQIKVNHTVSHLEFLNLGSQFDYLFLNDATFAGGDNPFLPSKCADYLATGTKIIAKIQPGSSLSEMKSANLIKTEELTPEFVAAIKKP